MRYRTQGLGLCDARFCVSRYATMLLGTVAHEAVRFAADYTVALAYSRFETSAIEDGDTASMITNQPGVLQTGSLVRDSFTTHPKHVGDEFLRHDEFVR